MTDPHRPENAPLSADEELIPPIPGAGSASLEDGDAGDLRELLWFALDALAAGLMAAVIVWLRVPESFRVEGVVMFTFLAVLLLVNGVHTTIRDARVPRFREFPLVRACCGAWFVVLMLLFQWMLDYPFVLYVWPLVVLPVMGLALLVLVIVHQQAGRDLRRGVALAREHAASAKPAALDVAIAHAVAATPSETAAVETRPDSSNDGNSPFWMLGIMLVALIVGALSARHQGDKGLQASESGGMQLRDPRELDADVDDAHIDEREPK